MKVLEMLKGLDDVEKLISIVMLVATTIVPIYSGMLDAIHVTDIEMLLMESKETYKKQAQIRGLAFLLFTIYGVVVDWFFCIYFWKEKDVVSGLIIITIMQVLLLYVIIQSSKGNQKSSVLERLASLNIHKENMHYLYFPIIVLLGAEVSSIFIDNANCILLVYAIVPLIDAVIISLVMEVFKPFKRDRESQYLVKIDNEKYYIHSKIGECLLCGTGKTMRKSKRMREIKISDLIDNQVDIVNLKYVEDENE